MIETKAPIRVGTSGWSYDHWQGPFYPPKTNEADRLRYYAQRFSTVEINTSFYRLPDEQTLQHWRDAVPAGFLFAVKASRYITHMKKLKDPGASLAGFFERLSILEDKLGPVLFQLPPRWKVNLERLETFLDALSEGFRYAFEFRDHSWLNEAVYERLERHGAAFCIYDLDGFTSPKSVTADFVYVRLHGPDGPYQGSYADPVLRNWARAFSKWSVQGRCVYCYFDNDQAGYAAKNAQQLRSMLDVRRRSRP